MTYVDKIIDKFGSLHAFAQKTGVNKSTVFGWKKRGSIPDAQKMAVLNAALKNGIKLKKADFFPHERIDTDG